MTTLITGANRGIGLELARQLHQRGESVIAVCRTASSELESLGVRVESGVDVSDPESVGRLAAKLDGIQIDTLINNAGVLSIEGLDSLDLDAIRRQFDVNAIGPILVTQKLLPNLAKGSKIGLITSRMGSISDNDSGGAYGYRMSKAALNIAGTSLAKDLHSRGISVALLHPGLVATDMTAQFGHNPQMQTPSGAATQLIARVDGLNLENSGTFWHANGEVLPW